MHKLLKILAVLIILIVLVLVLFTLSPYKIQRVCFGDLCPQNGGVFVLYKHNYSKEECEQIGGVPITGYGWGPVYAGCSPMSKKVW